MTELYSPSRGSRCTISRRAPISTTQYSMIPARAYRSAFVVRSNPNVEPEISTTRQRSAGRGLASLNSREGFVSTTRSGSGSLLGLSSGATSSGASGFTNCSPKVLTNQACTATRPRAWRIPRASSACVGDPSGLDGRVSGPSHCAGFPGILNTASSSGMFAAIFSTVISIAKRPFTICVRLNGISTPSTGL